MSNNEDIKARIKKMLDMANDERGNEHENEVALRMANRLMAKHGIDAADLELSTGKETSYTWSSVILPVGERTDMYRKNHPQWIGFLATGIGLFTDCKASYVNNSTYGICLRFQGDVIDIEFASYLFKMMRDYGYASKNDVPGSDRGSFLKAYGSRLHHRMKELVEERKTDMAVASAGTALVVVDRKLKLRDEAFGKQEYKKAAPSRMSSNGYARGREAADRVNFNRPVGQGSQNPALK